MNHDSMVCARTNNRVVMDEEMLDWLRVGLDGVGKHAGCQVPEADIAVLMTGD